MHSTKVWQLVYSMSTLVKTFHTLTWIVGFDIQEEFKSSKKCFVISGSEAPLGFGRWPGWHMLAGTGKDRWDKSIKIENIKLVSDLNDFV
ncbi:hypothetical protein TURU_029715 [Turdus rufiventris]|nr:hypothetical protein TURU_029715 [Turdus rufiventris]